MRRIPAAVQASRHAKDLLAEPLSECTRSRVTPAGRELVDITVEAVSEYVLHIAVRWPSVTNMLALTENQVA